MLILLFSIVRNVISVSSVKFQVTSRSRILLVFLKNLKNPQKFENLKFSETLKFSKNLKNSQKSESFPKFFRNLQTFQNSENGQVMSPYHSGHMSQGSQVSQSALLVVSQSVGECLSKSI